MAKAIHAVESTTSLNPSLRSIITLRLSTGYLILFGAIVALFGTVWDIQWHTFIGRDRTLIAPHIMILSGLALCGIGAIATVITETLWTRRNPILTKYTTSFADTFHSSLGIYVAGFATVCAAVAFPLDSYWHALYGIDVQIWAPFHVMIIGSGAIIPLGIAYTLIGTARLATSLNDIRATRIAYIGAIIALATMMSLFSLLLVDGTNDDGYFVFSTSFVLNIYPLLASLLVGWTLVAAVYAIPWRRVAIYVVLVYILFGLLFSAFVPPATSYLVSFEQLTYRQDLGIYVHLSIVAARFWSLTPIIAALLIDLFYRRAGRKQWSQRRLAAWLTFASFLGGLPIFALIPDYFLVYFVFEFIGPIGVLVALVLGVLGAFSGTWFGRRMGLSMQEQQ